MDLFLFVLRILLCEFQMELLDFVQQDLQLVCRWQDGHSGRARAERRQAIINWELIVVTAASARS